ncbi:MAG: hypothetical protein QHC89_29690 [Bosea sp. (in: a-proteobacteria)]|nr:hypothetical protein [Bosea sp. (in: a-proteobacteria)]
MSYIVFDLETTGLDPKWNLPLQAAMNASELMVAAEGARIAGYLAAAQVMIWPPRDTAGLAAKTEIVALINQRGEAGDPVEMQAAIRHVAAEAAWLKFLSPETRERLKFDWSEIV